MIKELNSKELGIKGEEIAVNLLKAKGYNIIERNWQFRGKEIDIIAVIENCLIIAEVKTRSYSGIIMPQDAVTKQKQRFLISATNEYIKFKNIDMDVRFDVIAIIINKYCTKVEHIEDAFYPLVR